jgi:hypothetical protein
METPGFKNSSPPEFSKSGSAAKNKKWFKKKN